MQSRFGGWHPPRIFLPSSYTCNILRDPPPSDGAVRRAVRRGRTAPGARRFSFLQVTETKMRLGDIGFIPKKKNVSSKRRPLLCASVFFCVFFLSFVFTVVPPPLARSASFLLARSDDGASLCVCVCVCVRVCVACEGKRCY